MTGHPDSETRGCGDPECNAPMCGCVDWGHPDSETRTVTLRERVQEITAEYWGVRDSQSERVAVAQLILALARAEAAAVSADETADK